MFKFTPDKGIEIALIKKGKNIVDRIYVSPDTGENFKEQTSKKNKSLKIIGNVFNVPTGFEIMLSTFLPEKQTLRHVFIGSSGAGKTTFAAKFIKSFHESHEDKQVYIFSRHDSDETLDDIIGDFSLRVKITEQDVIQARNRGEQLIELSDLSNSLCLFDDVNQTSTILTKYMYKLNDDLQQSGRHNDTSIIHIIHNTNYKETRFTLSEAIFYVFFINSLKTSLKKIMVNYCGLTDKEADYLLDLNVRWVAIRVVGYQYIITEKQIFTHKYLKKLVKGLTTNK